MKRGGPLRRRQALKNRQALNRNAALSRDAVKAAQKPRSRPSVSPEERRARKLVAARSGGICEGCGRRPATDWSHRVRRNVGPWCPSNGLHLCSDLAAPDGVRGCHEKAHHERTWARDERGWILRTTDDPLMFPAWLAGRGWVLLDPDGGMTSCDPPADFNDERTAA